MTQSWQVLKTCQLFSILAMKTLIPPITTEKIKNLQSGDSILITGIIYTARDAAHQKLIKLIQNNEELPFDLAGSVVYYTGPTPAKTGEVIGSCGPTTSGRMDLFTPLLLEKGVKILIGKGGRNQEIKNSLQKKQAIYCAATGGAGALIAEKILSAEIIAFPELGPEAIHKLEVKNFPATVINDLAGNDLYTIAKNKYAQ